MLEEHPGLITAADFQKKMESLLTIHNKLFAENHVPDLVGTSGSVPAAWMMTKEEIVAALKDTCDMLDERKVQFELMIHSLEREDAAAEDELEDNEDDNADEAGNDYQEEEEASGSSSEGAE
jgi:hypothetical protein